MRIAIAVLGLLALVSFPVHAAWTVTLKTGEVLTVESYWRDGDKTHLLRGGVDIIVDNDRIESMEDGAPEPETGVQSATARGGGGTAAAPAGTTAPNAAPTEAKPVEKVAAYRERLQEMSPEELAAEEQRTTNELLELQAERFAVQFGGKPEEEFDAIDRRFKQAQQRDIAAEAILKERLGQP